MEKPRKVTELELFNMITIREFNVYHRTNYINWTEVFGSGWVNTSITVRHKRYLNWYNKTFTKLGRALK